MVQVQPPGLLPGYSIMVPAAAPVGLPLGWSSRMPVPPDAIELSVAASEAMVIAEMILDDPHSSKLAALHVKEADRKSVV